VQDYFTFIKAMMNLRGGRGITDLIRQGRIPANQFNFKAAPFSFLTLDKCSNRFGTYPKPKMPLRGNLN